MILLWSAWAIAGPPASQERLVVALLQVMGYDRSCVQPGPLRIAVVSPAAGWAAADDIRARLLALRGVPVRSRVLGEPVVIVFAPDVDWSTRLTGIDAMLVAPGFGGGLATVASWADRLDVPLYSLDPAHAGRGPALVLAHEPDRVTLLYDGSAAEAQGAQFEAELTELARAATR